MVLSQNVNSSFPSIILQGKQAELLAEVIICLGNHVILGWSFVLPRVLKLFTFCNTVFK
ncbi:hypothetical protein KSS87_011775 [Heliosperma pusillum]|nr:hypothetical protein KSS87_011775 [Heliosperma pusillum]